MSTAGLCTPLAPPLLLLLLLPPAPLGLLLWGACMSVAAATAAVGLGTSHGKNTARMPSAQMMGKMMRLAATCREGEVSEHMQASVRNEEAMQLAATCREGEVCEHTQASVRNEEDDAAGSHLQRRD